MAAVLIALAASVLWGGADFIGGLITRHRSVLVVVAVVEGVGLAGILTIVAIMGEPIPGSHELVTAVAAGLSGVAGLALFYTALSIGTMSIVAPIAACGAALPAIYGLATGDPLSAVLGAGLAVAMIGIILASLEGEHEALEDIREGHRPRLSIALAGAAALGFGGYFILFDRAVDESILWSLVAARSGALVVIAGIIAVRRVPLSLGSDGRILVLAGLSDAGATGLYGVALAKGALSAVSVVGSLYPVTTVLLARIVLGERVRPVQGAGIALALTGVALIALG